MEPKLIEVPGIPGQLREQTLDEYMGALQPDHYARKELAEIRSNALKGIDYANQLIKANDKILELQTQLEAVTGTRPVIPLQVAEPEMPPSVKTLAEAERLAAMGWKPGPVVKVPCRFCGKEIARGKGYFKKHMMNAHPEMDADSTQEP